MAAQDKAAIAARVRAAFAYANVQITENRKPKDVGSIGGSTIARIASAAEPRGASVEELREIADACPGVPLAFLQAGWGPLEEPLTDTDLAIRELRAEVRQIQAALKPRAGAAPPELPTGLGQTPTVAKPTAGKAPRKRPRKAKDER